MKRYRCKRREKKKVPLGMWVMASSVASGSCSQIRRSIRSSSWGPRESKASCRNIHCEQQTHHAQSVLLAPGYGVDPVFLLIELLDKIFKARQTQRLLDLFLGKDPAEGGVADATGAA